jgi:hypothetical protein
MVTNGMWERKAQIASISPEIESLHFITEDPRNIYFLAIDFYSLVDLET